MPSRTVLVVEDDADSASILEAYLIKAGYDVVLASDGRQGLIAFHQIKPALIILDLMLPAINGNEVLSAVRKKDNTPVIMLTAIGDDAEKIGALRYGADDYVLKPCNPKEVVARVQAVLRRTASTNHDSAIIECDDVWVDNDSILAGVNRHSKVANILDLTRSEFLILAAMVKTPHKAFTRDELLDICMPESDAFSRVIDTHIHNIRRKLEGVGVLDKLITVRAVGYRFK